MRSLYLCDAQPGDLISDVVVVSNTQLSASTSGKLYIKAFVSDRTAQLTARAWNATRELFASIPDNAFVRIKGRVESFQNNVQVVIEEFAPAEPGTFDVADLLPTTTKDIDTMCQRLFTILGTIRHEETRLLVQEFLDDEPLMNDFARAPAASSFHHAFIGGLLEHTLNMLEVADRLVPLYPGTSRDLVLAGVFLHDIAKTWELSYDGAFGYTNGGQLIGHGVKSAMWIEEKAARVGKRRGAELPRMLVDTLQHLVLSHHGLPEHGAARVPMTPEAVFIHAIDNLDAKMTMSLAATRSPGAAGTSNGWWTEFLKPLNSKFFRGDPTSPECDVVPALSTGATQASAAQPEASAQAKPPRKPPVVPVTVAASLATPGTAEARPKPTDVPVTKPVLSNPLFDLGSVKKR